MIKSQESYNNNEIPEELYKYKEQEAKEIINNLDLETRKEVINSLNAPDGKLMKILVYFREQKLIQFLELGDNYQNIKSTLEKSFGFQLNTLLENYKSYIENNLQLGTGNTLTQVEYQKLLGNVKKLINYKLQEISSEVDKIIQSNNNKTENMQWIVNDKIKEIFAEINKSVLQSAKFVINMHDSEYKKSLEDKYQDIANPGAITDLLLHAKVRCKNIKQDLIESDINDGKVPSGLMYNDSLLGKLLSDNKDYRQDDILVADTSENHEINLLNEKDQAIESEAQMYFIGICLFQMLPVVGIIPSFVINIEDIYSDKEASMSYLKRLGLVPDNYEMSKTWIDNIFGAVGVMGTLIGFQGALQAGKLGKILKKIKHFDDEKFAQCLNNLGNKLKISTEHIGELMEKVREMYRNDPILSNEHGYITLKGINKAEKKSGIELYNQDIKEVNNYKKWFYNTLKDAEIKLDNLEPIYTKGKEQIKMWESKNIRILEIREQLKVKFQRFKDNGEEKGLRDLINDIRSKGDTSLGCYYKDMKNTVEKMLVDLEGDINTMESSKTKYKKALFEAEEKVMRYNIDRLNDLAEKGDYYDNLPNLIQNNPDVKILKDDLPYELEKFEKVKKKLEKFCGNDKELLACLKDYQKQYIEKSVKLIENVLKIDTKKLLFSTEKIKNFINLIK